MKTIENREVAYAALFSRLQGLREFKTITRSMKEWDELPPEALPALCMIHTGEDAAPERGLPTQYVFHLSLWVSVRTEGEPAGPLLNPLLDALEKALQPDNNCHYVQTLGGVVQHAWIEGRTEIFEGGLNGEAEASVPVKIAVN